MKSTQLLREVKQMQLSTRRPLLLGLLLISTLDLSASANDSTVATAQPFSCGSGIAANIVNLSPRDRHFGFGRVGKGLDVISFGIDDSKGGIDLRYFREPNKFSELTIYVLDRQPIGDVNTRFCFSDNDGDFTITRRLKEYKFKVPKDGFKLASVRALDLPTRANGANLKRFTLIVNAGQPTALRFGGISISGLDYIENILTENAGCDGVESCKKSNQSD